MLGGANIILPPASVPVEGLSEEEHLAFPLKASIETALEERAARWQASFTIELQITYPFLFPFFINIFLIRRRYPKIFLLRVYSRASQMAAPRSLRKRWRP